MKPPGDSHRSGRLVISASVELVCSLPLPGGDDFEFTKLDDGFVERRPPMNLRGENAVPLACGCRGPSREPGHSLMPRGRLCR